MSPAEPKPLLEAILDDPDEDGPRLAFADWLEEQGEPRRAEWLRVSCELARLSHDDPARKPLEQREQSLRAVCLPSWWGGFPKGLTVRPWRGLFQFEVRSATAVKQLGRSAAATRAVAEGWVERLQVWSPNALIAEALARWPASLRDAPLRVSVESDSPLELLGPVLRLPGLSALALYARSSPRTLDLSPLSGLTELRSLLVWAGSVDLRVLCGWTGLRELDVAVDRLSDADLLPLAGLGGLRKLNLRAPQSVGPSLAPLAGLTGLRDLDLSFQPLTDEGLPALAGLTGLRRLNLSMTKVTDSGLRHLAGLSGLESLALSNNGEVRDLSWAAGMTRMKRLRLFGCAANDDSLAHLAGMAELRSLDLGYCRRLRGDGLRHVEALPELAELFLFGCEGLREGLPSLARMRSLRRLFLSRCRGLAGSDFSPLADLPHLYTLTIPRKGGGAAQAERLRSRRPGLAVEAR